MALDLLWGGGPPNDPPLPPPPSNDRVKQTFRLNRSFKSKHAHERCLKNFDKISSLAIFYKYLCALIHKSFEFYSRNSLN